MGIYGYGLPYGLVPLLSITIDGKTHSLLPSNHVCNCHKQGSVLSPNFELCCTNGGQFYKITGMLNFGVELTFITDEEAKSWLKQYSPEQLKKYFPNE